MDGMAALSPTLRHHPSLTATREDLASGAISARSLQHIDDIAQDFEAVFMTQMMENMFVGIDMNPMTDDPGEDTYKSLLLDEYGKIISRSGGIGVADYVKQEMLKSQEMY